MQTSIACCIVLQMPTTEEDWLRVGQEFEDKWNFPHCVGALDGKHISILPPPNSGSLYFNYKQYFSIVLLALVDANYRFLYVDIGAFGRVSDGGVYNSSSIANALATNSIHIPPPAPISGTDIIAPYVIVADDAFALKSYQLKPYSYRQLTQPKQIFNYRLSRARRVIEQALGISSQRFRIFGRPIALSPQKVKLLVMTACCLHNYLLRNRDAAACYMSMEVEASEAGGGMTSLQQQGSNRSTTDAAAVRDLFCQYFNSADGAVSWQEERVNKL